MVAVFFWRWVEVLFGRSERGKGSISVGLVWPLGLVLRLGLGPDQHMRERVLPMTSAGVKSRRCLARPAACWWVPLLDRRNRPNPRRPAL